MLHFVVEHGTVETMKLLVDHGARVSAEDRVRHHCSMRGGKRR